MMETKLEISRDLKRVKYDDYVYDIKKIIHIPEYISMTTHLCSNNEHYSIEFNRFFEIENNRLHLCYFCPRCKVLFLKVYNHTKEDNE